MSFCLSLTVELTAMFSTETGKQQQHRSLCCLDHVFSSVHPQHSATAQQPTPPVTGQGLASGALLCPSTLSLFQAALPPPVPLGCESASAMLRRLMERL